MEKQELINCWNYFLSLEKDLDNTSRYIEPMGQEHVHSLEFAKILILACTEIEVLFNCLCKTISPNEATGNIRRYKEVILARFPKITVAEVSVMRWGKTISPFSSWDSGPLKWWGAYQNVKHNRSLNFDYASYENAAFSLAALYILVFYTAKANDIKFPNTKSIYFESAYEDTNVLFSPQKQLPDFEVTTNETTI